MNDDPLDPRVAEIIAAAVADDVDALVVGGQAVNFWARRYGIDGSHANDGPMLSKDIDFFGGVSSASRLSSRVGGYLRKPGLDDHTPNSAVLETCIEGKAVLVDFLDHVSGVDDTELRAQKVEVDVPAIDGSTTIVLSLMHPLHCLQSRVANYYRHGRTDPVAMRQLDAAPAILDAFVGELLEAGSTRAAQWALIALAKWLRSNEFGRKSHTICTSDPLDILHRYTLDVRLDQRFRDMTLARKIEAVKSRREKLQIPIS